MAMAAVYGRAGALRPACAKALARSQCSPRRDRMAIPQKLSETLIEASTGIYTCSLVDEAGSAIDPGFLDSLVVTAYDLDSHEIVNARDQQNILNANNGTVVTAPGPPVTTTVTLELQPEDTVILNQNRVIEYRVLAFRWTWDSSRRSAAHVVQFGIENVEHWP